MAAVSVSPTFSRRRLLAGLVAIGAGVALSACAPAPTPTAAPAQPARPAEKPAQPAKPAAAPPKVGAGQVLVSFSSQGNKDELDIFDRIIDGFEQSQTKIRVDRRYDPTLSWPKIINMIRAGVAADVQRTDDDSIYMLTVAGMRTTLDDYFRRDLRREDYYDIMFKLQVGPGGELGGAYVASAPIVAFFNLDLFEKAGIKPPTDWDTPPDMAGWEEMLAKLTKKSGDRVEVYGFHAPDWWIPTALYNAGVDFWTPDETRAVFATPEGIETLTRWQSWFKKGYFVPPGENPTQLFNSGLLAVKVDYPNFTYGGDSGR